MSSAQMPASEALMGVLRGVQDPELGDNIVDLGMVRSATCDEDGHAVVTIALTTSGCPMRASIQRDVKHRMETLPGVSDVRLVWDELNADEKARVMERARLTARNNADQTAVAADTRVLAISSGKGGVGKSSITTNLATGLAERGFIVGVLDADIWGYSVPRMLGVEGRLEAQKAKGETRAKIMPITKKIGSGMLKIVSMGLLVEEEGTALMWRGLMLTKALEQFLKDVAWGSLDYLLIDMPPGTGDVQMGLSRLLPQAEMIVVTTPALAAQKVAVRVADMARRSHMPVLGVIENMSAFVANDGTSYALFGEGGGVNLAKDLDIPLLGTVPLEPAVSSGGDTGTPAITASGPAAEALDQIVDLLVDEIAPVIDGGSCTARMMSNIEEALDAESA